MLSTNVYVYIYLYTENIWYYTNLILTLDYFPDHIMWILSHDTVFGIHLKIYVKSQYQFYLILFTGVWLRHLQNVWENDSCTLKLATNNKI